MRCNASSPTWATVTGPSGRLQPPTRDRRHPPGPGPTGFTAGRGTPPSPQGPRPGPDPDGQGRAVAGHPPPRDHRTAPVDPVDLRGLGRRDRPDDRRRLHQRRDHLNRRAGTRSPHAHRPTSHGQPRVLPRLPGMGLDRTSTPPGTGPATQRRHADRHRPAIIADDVWAKQRSGPDSNCGPRTCQAPRPALDRDKPGWVGAIQSARHHVPSLMDDVDWAGTVLPTNGDSVRFTRAGGSLAGFVQYPRGKARSQVARRARLSWRLVGRQRLQRISFGQLDQSNPRSTGAPTCRRRR